MRILLVNPSSLKESDRDLYSAHILGPLFMLRADTRMALGMPLALPTLAAHTPAEHSVRIIDEEIEELNFDEHVDLVGITAMTFKAKRAYEIAREFRARRVPVIMGGIHASMRPDEVSEHVDCVVVGEADDLWPRILADASVGKLKSRYVAEEFPDLQHARIPRYDLVKNSQYLYSYLQTTRGCPFECSFCTVTKMNGRRVRKKTPEQVIAELDALVRLNPKRSFNLIDRSGIKKKCVGTIAFIDDNFAIDRKHALAICTALKRYQEERNIVVLWYTQVNAEVGFDTELLEAMSNANCQHLFIGFESLDPATLESMKKRINLPERYEEAVGNIHRHGMRVIFSTIIGDDNTSVESAEYLSRFIRKNSIFHVLLNILTPYPGTELFEQASKENRILTLEPQLYNIRNVVFLPKSMTPSRLQTLYYSLCDGIFRYDEMYKRGRKLLGLSSRLFFPLRERIMVWLAFSCICLYFAVLRRLPVQIVLRLLLAAPSLILGNGSLFALELLATSADSDDFARSEAKRGSLQVLRDCIRTHK